MVACILLSNESEKPDRDDSKAVCTERVMRLVSAVIDASVDDVDGVVTAAPTVVMAGAETGGVVIFVSS